MKFRYFTETKSTTETILAMSQLYSILEKTTIDKMAGRHKIEINIEPLEE